MAKPKTKRTSLDGLLQSAQEASVPPPAAPRAPEEGRASRREGIRQQSLYLPAAAYEQVRQLAFEERRKIHDYYMEGLDLVFAKRGLRSIAELTKDKP